MGEGEKEEDEERQEGEEKEDEEVEEKNGHQCNISTSVIGFIAS